MIKNFKIFESVNIGEPEIGDYVIVKPGLYLNLIGKILGYKPEYFYKGRREGEYDVDFGGVQKVKKFLPKEIDCWSKNKEDLELIIQSNKYNL